MATGHFPTYDSKEHYRLNTGPVDEFGDAPEAKIEIKNIGWTLGNDCPYRCTHCYSMSARQPGRDLEPWMVVRIVSELKDIGVETVNLGGNEPLFTGGLDPKKSLLPLIVQLLHEAGIEVGLTTSGVTMLYLYRNHKDIFTLLNDVDISLDSPFEEEHNHNRGARLYRQAIECLEICARERKPHSIIMAGMNWNFSHRHIESLVEIARTHGSHVRINPVKVVEPSHNAVALPVDTYYAGFAQLMQLCEPIELGEPPLAAKLRFRGAKRCPCGRSSFRIHSITPDGAVYVSPCVYLHDYKAPYNLLQVPLRDIIRSPQFRVFRQRNANPEMVVGCQGCELVQLCGGGCSARSFLDNLHATGVRSFKTHDPYCPIENPVPYEFPEVPSLERNSRLVHMDYLCTWIGKPRS